MFGAAAAFEFVNQMSFKPSSGSFPTEEETSWVAFTSGFGFFLIFLAYIVTKHTLICNFLVKVIKYPPTQYTVSFHVRPAILYT